MAIRIKRIYDQPDRADGFRVLVDRLWPRGLSKAAAGIDLWLKDIAPSDSLRKWFAHDPKKWPEFRRRYSQEVLKNPALGQLKELAGKEKILTLLFAASDETRNNAQVLKDILEG